MRHKGYNNQFERLGIAGRRGGFTLITLLISLTIAMFMGISMIAYYMPYIRVAQKLEDEKKPQIIELMPVERKNPPPSGVKEWAGAPEEVTARAPPPPGMAGWVKDHPSFALVSVLALASKTRSLVRTWARPVTAASRPQAATRMNTIRGIAMILLMVRPRPRD